MMVTQLQQSYLDVALQEYATYTLGQPGVFSLSTVRHAQVSTPADYTGPVLITFAASSGNTAVVFNITPQLVVKVIASAFASG